MSLVAESSVPGLHHFGDLRLIIWLWDEKYLTKGMNVEERFKVIAVVRR